MLYILTESKPDARGLVIHILYWTTADIYFLYIRKHAFFCSGKLATEFFKPLVKKSSELYNLEKDRKLVRGEKDKVTL